MAGNIAVEDIKEEELENVHEIQEQVLEKELEQGQEQEQQQGQEQEQEQERVQEQEQERVQEQEQKQERVQEQEQEQGNTSIEQRAEAKFLLMLEGRRIPSALRAPDHPPPWLDKEAARRGREVFFAATAGLCLGWAEALFMGMCIPNFYRPLVFTRQSHTSKLAMKRYIDTGALMYSWYQSDCWEEESLSSSMIRRVNAMHRNVAVAVRPLGLTQLAHKVEEVFRQDQLDTEASLTTQDRIFLSSVSEARSTATISPQFWQYVDDSTLFSQMDMTLVQAAFFAPFLLFPDHYGASWLTQRQMADFMHLWRVNGWYLGISEDNNAAQETLEDTLVLGRIVLEKILKPCMLNISPDSLYMAKTALQAGGDYHVMAYTSYELVGIPLDKLWQSFTTKQVLRYYFRRLFIRHLYPLPGVRQAINWLYHTVLTKLLYFYMKK